MICECTNSELLCFDLYLNKFWNKMTELRNIIEQAWENRELLAQDKTQETIREVINLIDLGKLRCAEPTATGWQINEWVKKAVVLYFP
ncbi:MAG: 2,3,4,5-tetrahydropyridine-2-carboxylate N-succinyltransferase, partial [Maribacter sp.]